MKTLKLLLVVALMAFLYSCSDESNPSQEEGDVDAENSAARYYPGEVGSRYSYSYTGLSKALDGTQAGIRIVTFTGTSTKDNEAFIEQRNVNYLGIDSTVNISFFRRTENGVYFFIDTTGLSAFIPDSIRNIISVSADKRVLLFKKEFADNNAWSAYKMNIVIANTIPVNIINVQAKHVATETITLNLTNGSQNVQAEKIKYDLIFSMPNMETYQTTTSVFTAYIWYSKNIGMVKMDGNTTVLQALSGNNIDFDDTTKVMTQTLTDFKLK